MFFTVDSHAFRAAQAVLLPGTVLQPAAASSRSASSGVDGGGPALPEEQRRTYIKQAPSYYRKRQLRGAVSVLSLVLRHSGLTGAACDVAHANSAAI